MFLLLIVLPLPPSLPLSLPASLPLPNSLQRWIGRSTRSVFGGYSSTYLLLVFSSIWPCILWLCYAWKEMNVATPSQRSPPLSGTCSCTSSLRRLASTTPTGRDMLGWNPSLSPPYLLVPFSLLPLPPSLPLPPGSSTILFFTNTFTRHTTSGQLPLELSHSTVTHWNRLSPTTSLQLWVHWSWAPISLSPHCGMFWPS